MPTLRWALSEGYADLERVRVVVMNV